MKISKLGLKNVRLESVDPMYPAQDILFKTSQVKQYGSGVYAYDNIPLKVQDNLEEIIKKHFNKIDCIETEMPILQQEELWRSSNRWEKYIEDGVMLTVETDKGNYCIAPTAEEAITKFIENRVTSHKQLPVAYYQISPKFRNEIRNRGYLFRGKQFLMFDLYSFDKDEEGMNDIYDKVKQCYFDIFEELGLKLVAVAADNGAIGGSKSEEMMIVTEVGEDTILYDETTNQGLNIEVLDKENASEYLSENYGIKDISKLKKLKALELGHIFALGTKYSETMGIKYVDTDNTAKPFQMGCYGIGVSRVLAVIYENNTIQENGQIVGFSLPLEVTPYYLYIIPNKNRMEEAMEIYKTFVDNDIPVIIDDTNASMGEKIRNAKILGIPYTAVLGNNTEVSSVELERTRDNAKKIISSKELFDNILGMRTTKKDIEF